MTSAKRKRAARPEPLTRVRDRLMHWLLSVELAKHDVCKPVAALYARRLAGHEPTAQEWRDARSAAYAAAYAADAAAYAAAAYAAAAGAAAAGAAVAAVAAGDAAYADARSAARTRIAAELARLLGKRCPKLPRLDRAILIACKDGERLDMGSWHCGTTHCRAGWAIALGGAAGKKLESVFGPALAGAAIYYASTGRVPNFYAQSRDALRDIRECAAKEATP
jgi:hypothetical protein